MYYFSTGKSLSIYEIGSGPVYPFMKIQSNPYPSIKAVTFIEIQQNTYLIFGVYEVNIMGTPRFSWATQIQIFRYNKDARYFNFDSVLPGSGVTDIECFTSQMKTYLVVANYRDDVGSLQVLSAVFEYNKNLRRFQMFQTLVTRGATDVEHFMLSNEHYIVIANQASGVVGNSILDSASSVYRLNNGKFQMLQTLDTDGAVIWEHIPVPNCKQDVLLVYGDQRDNNDQIGVYSFSHHQESFGAVPFQIYGRENLTTGFRPRPKAIATFSIQNNVTGEMSLMVIIGAGDSTEGHSVYELTYEVILRDSPLEAFKRFVKEELNTINSTLEEVKDLLDQAEEILADAVLKSQTEVITGAKTINDTLTLTQVTIDTLTITNGSILYQGTHLANPDIIEHIDFNELKTNVSVQDSTLKSIVENEDKYWYYDTPNQIVNQSMLFTDIQTDELIVQENFTTDTINGIDVNTVFNELVTTRDSPVVITSTKQFQPTAAFDSLDIVLDGVDQNITGNKVVYQDINILENLNTGMINGINIPSDCVFVNLPVTLTGSKTFDENTIVSNTTIKSLLNGIDFNTLFSDVFRKSIPQTVSGRKTVNTILSNGSVTIKTLVNGINLQNLLQSIIPKGDDNIISGNKIFIHNVTIQGNLICNRTVNGINLPTDVLTNDERLSLYETQHFNESVVFEDNLMVHNTIAGVNTSNFVLLTTDQVLRGDKEFQSDVVVSQDLSLEVNRTINNIDFSDLAENIITLNTEQSLSHLEFADVSINQHSIETINQKTLSEYEELYRSSLHKTGDQILESALFADNVKVSGHLEAPTINGYKLPEDFALTSGNHTFFNHVTFVNNVNFTSGLAANDSVMDVHIIEFLENLLFKDRNESIDHSMTFKEDVNIEGDLISNSTINHIDFSDQLLLQNRKDQEITGYKVFDKLDISNLHVTVQGDVHVSKTIDGVDLSELDLSAMTISKNETITGSKCFENTDYNRSVEYVNGIDLSALRDDIVTVDTNQTILSEKVFEDMIVEADIETTSTVNGIDISELKDDIFTNDNPGDFDSLVIEGNLHIKGNLSSITINSADMSILENIFSKVNDHNLSFLVVHGHINTINLQASVINDLVLSNDIVYRSFNRSISGHKFMQGEFDIDSLQSTNINSVHFNDLVSSIVYKHTTQTITGSDTFWNETILVGDINGGLVNSLDLNDWKFIRIDG